MNDVPKKFRAQCFDTDKLVYGNLINIPNHTFLFSAATWDIYDEDPKHACIFEYPFNERKFRTACVMYPVKRESVSQLVGYDANGDEVYEGDTLCAPYGNSIHFQAGVTFLQAVCDDFGTKVVLNADSVMKYKLKLKKGNGK